MDEKLKKEALSYDLKSLKNSLAQFDKNIESLEISISREQDAIDGEKDMIRAINDSSNKADPKLKQIDTARLQDSIAGHNTNIDTFKTAIEEELVQARKTQRMITYLEVLNGS